MTTLLDGTKLEEFAINVAEYLQRQVIMKEAEKRLNETKDALKAYMNTEGLKEAEVGHHIVRLLDISRESVDTKVAKVVIPKKYLEKEGVLTTTTYQELSFPKKK